MWIRVTLELSESVCCDTIIEFRCVSRGYRATYWEPGEGPEFEIVDAYVEEAWGNTWNKGRQDLGDWVALLDRMVNEVVDDLDLYEAQCNEYDSWGDY